MDRQGMSLYCHRLPWSTWTAMDCHGLPSTTRSAMYCHGLPWTATQCILNAHSSFGANADRHGAVVAAGGFAVEAHEEANLITLRADCPEASNKKSLTSRWSSCERLMGRSTAAPASAKAAEAKESWQSSQARDGRRAAMGSAISSSGAQS